MAETAEKIADDAAKEQPAGTEEPVSAGDSPNSSSGAAAEPPAKPSAPPAAETSPAAETPKAAPAATPAAPPAKTQSKEPPKPLTCTATLLDRYLIDGSKPLPHLDSPTALAYEATEQGNPTVKFFALMCQPGMPIRVGTIRKMRAILFKGNIPVADWGYVFWEPAGRAVAAVILEQPMGGSLTQAVSSGETRIGEYDVVKRVVLPALEGITSLFENGLVHRAIRPDNLFFMDEDRTEIVLGECVTTPPGYDQPSMYESVERSMCPPSGRGRGESSDDVYALGIAIVMILLGYNPLKRYSTLDIIAAKVEKGTYAAVCGNARLPMSIIELLRGLMSDDENQRWALEQIDAWANGRKQTPLQRQGQRKASSSYSFDKQAHLSPRTLAFAFAANHEEAYRTLKSDENFEGWLRRSLSDEEMADIYKALMDHATSMAGSPTAEPDVIISRICMLLDPHGPIRFRGYALMPDALGPAVAIETMVNNNPDPITGIIEKEVYEFWFKTQTDTTNENLNQQRSFVKCRGHLKLTDIGYGIERILYELNEFIPCQSELIIEHNVSDCGELLTALDKISNKVESGTRPIDRHVAAFAGTRFTEDIHLHLKAIAAPSIERSAIGVLSLFAFIQLKTIPGPLLGLASWVGGQAGPAINTYHSRSTRRELEREIPQLVRKGSLPELFELIESAEKRRLDAGGFNEAQDAFVGAENEIIDIIGVEGERDSKLLQAGQKATALISIMLSMTVVTMLFMLDIL